MRIIQDAHHIHVWTIDGEINIATLHVVVNEINSDIKGKIKEELHEHGISHVTVEMETPLDNCNELTCDIKGNVSVCHHHH